MRRKKKLLENVERSLIKWKSSQPLIIAYFLWEVNHRMMYKLDVPHKLEQCRMHAGGIEVPYELQAPGLIDANLVHSVLRSTNNNPRKEYLR